MIFLFKLIFFRKVETISKKQYDNSKRSIILLGIITLISLQAISSDLRVIDLMHETIHTKVRIGVTGKVTNESGDPLVGVTVSIKETNIAVTTDQEGRYTIVGDAPKPILVFSHVGYETMEIEVKNQKAINVTLINVSTTMDDLVVVGYGTMRREDLTGAISSIKINQEEVNQYNSVDALIRGRSPGVNVNANNAAPGSTMSVKIRGINSLRGDNEPLYVVDGIVMSSPAEGEPNALTVGNFADQEPQNGLAGINPRDIESIDILKDAAATAIFGSRGANGVVLITTKMGKGRSKVAIESTTSVNVVSKKIDVLDGLLYAKYQNEMREGRGERAPYNFDDMGNVYKVPSEDVLNRYPDSLGTLQRIINWQDEVYRPTISQNSRATISGSNDNTKYYFALGYLNQQGVVRGTGLGQGDIRLNLEQKVSSKFTISSTINAVVNKNDMIIGTEQSGLQNLMRNIKSSPPLRLSKKEQAEILNSDFEDHVGPETFLAGYDDKSQLARVMASIRASYKISKSFTYRINFGGSFMDKNRERWQGPEISGGNLYNGMAGQSSLSRIGYNLDNLLIYNNRVSKNGRLIGTAGAILSEDSYRSQIAQGSDFPISVLRFDGIGFGNVYYPARINKTKTSLVSGIMRLNYIFKGKYNIGSSFRADGSSKFVSGNQFSYFPSFSFGWNINKENFLKEVGEISDLKLRLSWGRTGNQGIGAYGTFDQYGIASYPNVDNNLGMGTAITNIANADLKWETTEQMNAGLDFALFDNRLTGSFDIFDKRTYDLLQNIPISYSSGFKTMLVNQGDISNKGLELGINGLLIDKAVQFELGGNISFVKNKIMYLGLEPSDFGMEHFSAFLGDVISNAQIQDPANIFITGYPMALFWGYKTDGVYEDITKANDGPTYLGVPNMPGDIRYVDLSGDGVINDLDKTIIGNPNPKFTYGLNADLKYKNFSFHLYAYGSYGNRVINSNLWDMINPLTGQTKNIRRDAYEQAWRPDAPDTKFPRINSPVNFLLTDRYVEDASFLRLGLATLSWNIPIKSSKIIKAFNLNVTGRNLFILTKYSGYDPEVNSFAFNPRKVGIDLSSYPHERSYVLGVNVTF